MNLAITPLRENSMHTLYIDGAQLYIGITADCLIAMSPSPHSAASDFGHSLSADPPSLTKPYPTRPYYPQQPLSKRNRKFAIPRVSKCIIFFKISWSKSLERLGCRTTPPMDALRLSCSRVLLLSRQRSQSLAFFCLALTCCPPSFIVYSMQRSSLAARLAHSARKSP